MKTYTIKAEKSSGFGLEMLLICIAGIAVVLGWIPT